MSKRVVLLISVLLSSAMVFLLPGCGTAAPAAPERSRIVNIGYSEKPTTLDPHHQSNQGSENPARMVFETLIYSDHQGNYTPMLAESWEIDPAGMFWTFKLRQGVTFSNGEPFDADDVVCTFQRLIDDRDTLNYPGQYWRDLASVEKIDQFTVKINFTEPYPLAANSFRGTYIIPNEAYEKYGEELFNLQLSYGTGPWVLKEWIDGQYCHFTKNQNYWNKAEFDSYFDEVYIRHVLEPSSAVAAHLSGDIDAYIPGNGMDRNLVPLYAGTENRIELFEKESNTIIYIQFQFAEGNPFSDINVRRAFDAAIDRQLIIDHILGGGTFPVGLLPLGVIGHDPNVEPHVYDPELARQYLADSSYNGEPVSILLSYNLMKSEDIGLAIADMCNKVGFNMTVSVEEHGSVNTKRFSGNYDLVVSNTMFVDGIPYRHLNSLYLHDNYKSHYYDEVMFDNIRQFNQSMDAQERIEVAQQITRQIREELANMTPLAVLKGMYAVDYGITGIRFYPDGMLNFCYVDFDPSLLR